MADERITITQRPGGGNPFIRVAATVVSEEGQDWLVNEITARGYEASDLGKAVRKGRFIEIPIRRES